VGQELNQAYVDHLFHQIKDAWWREIGKSGLSEYLFVISNPKAVEFLEMYNKVRDSAERLGLTIPELVEDLEDYLN
jgi:hypothetical protein